MADRPGSLARDRVREARRGALIEAAEQVFAERGYAGATMAEIAARAGYSAGNLYNVFEGKEALFRAVVASRGELLLERLRSALAGAPRLAARIDAFVEALVSFTEEHRAFFAIYLQRTNGLAWSTGGLDREVLELEAALEQELSAALEHAVEAGEIPYADPRLYACLLLGTLQRFLTRWSQHDGGPEPLWRGADSLRAMLLRALGVP